MGSTRRFRRALATAAALALAATTVVVTQILPASANVLGSNFEIDDGNLKVDGADPPALDWANVTETRQDDLGSGSGDNSFGQGSAEDTECPTVVDGSIPPNKSDLKTFGLYQETNANGDFLHMFWTRVQNPSGTTNMDFEFNQNDPSEQDCGNGVTPVRASGDLLITYNLSKGGTVPSFFIHTWLVGTEEGVGSAAAECETAKKYPCWGAGTALADGTQADGSVNSLAIPGSESDGLVAPTGQLDPFTFGEGTVDLSVVFPDGECRNFGSAYLKSRSSDSFNSALKDFIAPTDFTITNCDSIEITKTDGSGPLNGSRFTLYTDNAPPGDNFHDAAQWYPADNTPEAFLDGAVIESQTSITVDDTSELSPEDLVLVEAELMKIDSVDSATTLTVLRGQGGTAAAAHDDGLAVNDAVAGEDTATTTGDSGAIQNSGGISATDTSITLDTDEGEPFDAPGVVQIDDELILVDSITDDTLDVTDGRGYAGTTAASHAEGALVEKVFTCEPFSSDPEATDPVIPATCEMDNIFFGAYWVVETTVPSGYNGAVPQLVTLDNTTTNELTFNNEAAPVDLSVHKQTDDGTSTTSSPVPICWDDDDDNLDITDGCASFGLYDRDSTSLDGAVSIDDTSLTVDAATIFSGVTTPFEIVVDDGTPGNAETLVVTEVTNETLTLDEAATKAHADGAVVSLVPDFGSETAVSTCDPADNTEALAGECTFANVVPGDYWINEDTQPDGYDVDSSLPKAITVSLGDTVDDHDYSFTNPRLFTVIVLVCNQTDDTLYQSSVTFDGETEDSLSQHAVDVENRLCSALGGARFEDRTYGTYGDAENDDVAIDIPQNQNP